VARALRGAADVPAALRAFERERAPRVSVVARQAGSEDINSARAVLIARLVPGGLAARYYTRFLGQISSYLAAA
jgi:hypothetical protein